MQQRRAFAKFAEGKTKLRGGENHELPWLQHGVGGKRPEPGLIQIVRQRATRQVNRLAARVQQLEPVLADVGVRQEFVDPN